MKTTRTAVMALTGLIALALSACGGGGGGGGETTVNAKVQEFAVIPDEASAPAGSITFSVENTGPEDTHEFVIVKTDLAPDELPTDKTGAVDEEGEGVEVVDEIEDIEVGDTKEVTADLESGSYVLICNIYDKDEKEAHYAMGMRTDFTVE